MRVSCRSRVTRRLASARLRSPRWRRRCSRHPRGSQESARPGARPEDSRAAGARRRRRAGVRRVRVVGRDEAGRRSRQGYVVAVGNFSGAVSKDLATLSAYNNGRSELPILLEFLARHDGDGDASRNRRKFLLLPQRLRYPATNRARVVVIIVDDDNIFIAVSWDCSIGFHYLSNFHTSESMTERKASPRPSSRPSSILDRN